MTAATGLNLTLKGVQPTMNLSQFRPLSVISMLPSGRWHGRRRDLSVGDLRGEALQVHPVAAQGVAPAVSASSTTLMSGRLR